MSLFVVEKKHIEQLDSGQLLRVLKRLLEFEAKEHGITQCVIDVPLNENDPDGGIDGCIKWDIGPEKTENIPNKYTGFQSKAMDMPAAECKKELVNKGKIKPGIREVLDAGGSYIFFCRKAYTPTNIEDKIKKIAEMLKTKGYTKKVKKQIKFYDGNRIANWVNQYFPVRVYVMKILGRYIIPGLQTWEIWNAKFGGDKYHSTEKLNGWMGAIREVIAHEQRNAIRITGLSGLGKTRLALEVFRPPDDGADIEQVRVSDSVVYYQADSDADNIVKFITEYRDSANTTFVIDECSSKLHTKLTSDALSNDSKINLITICNEPDHSQSTDTIRILLVPEDFRDVVKEVLKDTYAGRLPENDISKITEFAGGFPVIAVELAKVRLKGGNTLELTDGELVRKILWGQGEEVPEIMAVLQACSLFKEFRLEDDNRKLHEQAKFICDVVTIDHNVSVNHDYFYSTIKKYVKRKIIQKYGRYYRIEPVPLALKLAKLWYESARSDKIETVIEEVNSKGLLDSFCEQSRRFDCIPEAADLIEELCGPTCPFSNAEVVLSVAGSRIFRSFAEVNPKPVIECLFRVLTSPETKAINIIGHVRRNLYRSLERLAWHAEFFDKTIEMLKILALAENESWSNNCTGLFLQLFHIALPGTRADLSQRQNVITNMIDSDDIDQKILAVKAIKHVFQSGHFSRGGGVESQGTKAPESDYYPTGEEVEEYWKTNLELLTNLIVSGEGVADEARKVFANVSVSLIRHDYISEIEDSVKKILSTGIFWHEMLVRIENLLVRENKFDDDVIKRLRALSSSLEPQAFPDKVRHYISAPDWLHRKGEDGHYINLSDKKAEQLADELSNSDELWSILPLIYEGEQRQGFTFGKRLADKLKDVSRFTKQSIVVLEKSQTPNILVLSGFLFGLGSNSILMQVLSELAESKKLVSYVPELLQVARAKKECLDFILKLLKEHKLTIDNLNVLRYGSPLGALEPKEAMSFCGDISDIGVYGARQALEILYMYCYGTPGRFEQCKEQFIAIMYKKKLLSGDLEKLDVHTWSEVIKRYISETPAEFSEHICKELVSFCESDTSNKLSALSALKNVTAELLKNRYEIVWPYFGNAILGKKNWEASFGISHLLEVGCGDTKKADESSLAQIPYDYLQSWCQQNIPKGPAAIMRLLPIVWEENDANYGIDELSRKLLLDFGTYKEVQRAASNRIFSFTSWGSREPYCLRRIDVLDKLKKSTKSNSLKAYIDAVIVSLRKDAQGAKDSHDEFTAGII